MAGMCTQVLFTYKLYITDVYLNKVEHFSDKNDHLFICGLFNDTINSSDLTVLTK
jgi:hypothetical protein